MISICLCHDTISLHVHVSRCPASARLMKPGSSCHAPFTPNHIFRSARSTATPTNCLPPQSFRMYVYNNNNNYYYYHYYCFYLLYIFFIFIIIIYRL